MIEEYVLDVPSIDTYIELIEKAEKHHRKIKKTRYNSGFFILY